MFTESSADPALGTRGQERVRPLPLYIWAKYGVIDQLLAYFSGAVGDWQEFEDIGEKQHQGYLLEVTATSTRDREGRDGSVVTEIYNKRVDDHWSDCEQMQIVAADASGMLNAMPLFDQVQKPKVKSADDERGVFDDLESEI